MKQPEETDGTTVDGSQDVRRAAEELARRLPAPLRPLADLAYNYRWSWMPEGEALFARLAPHRWHLARHNPVRLLHEISRADLDQAAADAELLAALDEAHGLLAADLDRPVASGPASAAEPIAFLCAEFGIHRSLPIYSGGLGALAGDIVKQASDLALPFVAVGLLYHQGYFHQRLDVSGWQHEHWSETDPEQLPAALVTAAGGDPLTLSIPVRGRDVAVQVWRVDVGRVPLFLLDTRVPENSRVDRWITSRLYVGDADVRLAQYALLGRGAVQALHAMGIQPGILHLNEGHAALAPLELAATAVRAGGTFSEAFEAAKARTVFTTHTPVAAGNETYAPAELAAVLGDMPDRLGLSIDQFIDLARVHPGNHDDAPGMTSLALRSARAANGVSRRHGEVARQMWRPVFDGDAPIGHVTNGVHLPTWIAPPMRELLDRHLGDRWLDRADDPQTWEAVDGIAPAELWAVRTRQRQDLVDFVRDRSVMDRLNRGEPAAYVEEAAKTFDADILTVGFARRVATYKRLHLLIADAARALALLGGDRPLQILLAGKAHPKDEEAKRIVQDLFTLKAAPVVAGRVAYLEDYDLAMAQRLVAGCDVWLNVPRPPLEASGTSGMKSAVNGGLNLSVLDGWWAEAYDGTNGWGIDGTVDDDAAAQDARDAQELYRLLEEDVVPLFHQRDASGCPEAWVGHIKASLKTVGPQFSAARMVRDYWRGPYAG